MQFLCSDMNHSLKLVFLLNMAYNYLQEITKSNHGGYPVSTIKVAPSLIKVHLTMKKFSS